MALRFPTWFGFDNPSPNVKIPIKKNSTFKFKDRELRGKYENRNPFPSPTSEVTVIGKQVRLKESAGTKFTRGRRPCADPTGHRMSQGHTQVERHVKRILDMELSKHEKLLSLDLVAQALDKSLRDLSKTGNNLSHWDPLSRKLQAVRKKRECLNKTTAKLISLTRAQHQKRT